MEIKGRLGVQFFNLGCDAHENESLDVREYVRVDRCWNIYFHGFMDRYDDIAYVKTPTNIEPGIYEVVVYGIPAYLFLWKYTDDHARDLKGLVCKVDDARMVEDAYRKFSENQHSI